MKLRNLLEELENYDGLQIIKVDEEADVDSATCFPGLDSDVNDSTLYIADAQKTIGENLKDFPGNIISVREEDVEHILKKTSKAIAEYQKMAVYTAQLMEALVSGKGLQHIVDVSSQILGNPFFVRDMSFEILAYTKDVQVKDRVWNQLTTKGYQGYEEFQYLMKNQFIERINKADAPIYYQIRRNDSDEKREGEMEEVYITARHKYILQRRYDEDIRISRVWCKIVSGQEIIGHVVVLEAVRNFIDRDFILIQRICEVIALELQKKATAEKSLSLRQDLIFHDLLGGKIKSEEVVDDKLKILNLKFRKNLRLITLTTNQNSGSGLPLNYIKSFLEHILGNIVFTTFEGNMVIVYHSDNQKFPEKTHLNQLTEFLSGSGMVCGISRWFGSLLRIQEHYKQCTEAVKAGIRLDKGKMLFLYEDYVLQHMFAICSVNHPLQSFCNSALLKLLRYDRQNGTDFNKTLFHYVMKFRNPSELSGALNIHRNTLYYRLGKIEEIMEISLQDMDALYSLYLSYKIIEYSGIPEI